MAAEKGGERAGDRRGALHMQKVTDALDRSLLDPRQP
jgi:hypothetical protein